MAPGDACHAYVTTVPDTCAPYPVGVGGAAAHPTRTPIWLEGALTPLPFRSFPASRARRAPSGAPGQVVAQRQSVDVAEGLQRDVAQGVLAHGREDAVAQLGGERIVVAGVHKLTGGERVRVIDAARAAEPPSSPVSGSLDKSAP